MTENRCFPSPQQTSARRAKTAKTLDSPGLGQLPVLSLSAYATISGRSLLRAFLLFLGITTTLVTAPAAVVHKNCCIEYTRKYFTFGAKLADCIQNEAIDVLVRQSP